MGTWLSPAGRGAAEPLAGQARKRKPGSVDFGLVHIFAKVSRWLDVSPIGNLPADVAVLASLGLTLSVGFLLRWWTCKPECRITVIALPLVASFAPFSAFASYGVVERCALSFAFLLTAPVDVRASAPRLQPVGALALATLDRVLVPDFYLKAGQQPVLYGAQNAALRKFQDDIENGDKAFRSNDGMLRAWAADLQDRFPDLQARFAEVYLAVFNPQWRLSETPTDWQLVATLPEHRLYRMLPR